LLPVILKKGRLGNEANIHVHLLIVIHMLRIILYTVPSRIKEMSDYYRSGHSSSKSVPHPTKREITSARHAAGTQASPPLRGTLVATTELMLRILNST